MSTTPTTDTLQDKVKANGKINHNITPAGIVADAEKVTHQINSLNGEVTGRQLLLEAPEEMDWLLNNLMPRTGLGCVAGGSDLGKSTYLRALGINVVTRTTDFLGFNINAVHNSVIIACSEDDRNAISFLLGKQTKGLNPDRLEDLRFIFETENLLCDLDKNLTSKPADLIIVDCFADFYAGDLKDTQKIRIFLNPFQQLSVKHNCFILFLHHTGKRTENIEPSKNNLLSGQGFEAKMRLVIELRADLMNPTHRHLCIVKGNYLPSSMKRESYVLRFDEHDFSFTNTGERMPYEMLAKQVESDNGKAMYEQALDLKNSGLNYDQIAEKLGYKSKGSVTKLFERAEKNGWNNNVSSVSKGNKRETVK